MKLYLLRHGIAEDRSASGSDADRALTREGISVLEAVLRRAAAAAVRPSLILTSPHVRARQTAEIAKRLLRVKEDPLATNTLVPEGEPQLVWAELSDHRTEPEVMLVTHNPLAEQLVAFFLGAPTLRFDFTKGAIVAMELGNFRGAPDGVLDWIVKPV